MRSYVGLTLAAALLAAAAPAPALSPADQAAAMKAAGYVKRGTEWRSACGLEAVGYYEAGRIETVRDLNGDGAPEAIITEGGTYCYGMTGAGFVLVSKQAGGWKRMTGGTGIPAILPTTGVGGWPDIEIGGPGFCFPVERWNGRVYKLHRQQYEGKPCRR